MSDDNTPKGTVTDEPQPDDFLSGVDAIDDLLEDSDIPNTGDEDEGQDADVEDEADGDDPEVEDEDDADDLEDDDDEGDDDDDSQPASSQGRFVSHDAKVRLPDGTVKTVAELAKSPLLQSDYTRKTQEIAEERKSVESAKSEISGYAQQLRQERDFLLQIAQQFLPQEPDAKMIDEDFFGYQHAKADYEKKMQVVQQLRQQAMYDQQRQQHETQAQMQERLNREAQILATEMPELAKPETYQKFWASTVDVMSEYGFTPEELEQATDHRFFRVFRDLMKLRKARKTAPQVREKVKGKPVLKSGRRMDTKHKANRDRRAKAERAAKTGSIDDAVESLMDFEL